jgi:hypothetical protein
MPLPPHLARYDALLDFLVEELVREMADPETKTPADHDSGGGDSRLQEQADEGYIPAAPAATVVST